MKFKLAVGSTNILLFFSCMCVSIVILLVDKYIIYFLNKCVYIYIKGYGTKPRCENRETANGTR